MPWRSNSLTPSPLPFATSARASRPPTFKTFSTSMRTFNFTMPSIASGDQMTARSATFSPAVVVLSNITSAVCVTIKPPIPARMAKPVYPSCSVATNPAAPPSATAPTPAIIKTFIPAWPTSPILVLA